MSDRVGVLGATGYVGDTITRALADGGLGVRPAAGSSHPSYPTVDVRDRGAVRSFVTDCDCVVNAAGLVGVARCADRPDDAFAINAQGAGTVAWACAQAGVPLVHCSSVATLGKPESLPLTADHDREPTTVYGRSKLAGDRLVETATDGLVPSITLALTNPFGTDRSDDGLGDSVLDFFLERARTDDSLPVHRPGSQERDLIHVGDAARAVAAAVDLVIDPATEPRARSLLLGSGDAHSVLQLAGLVAARAPGSPPIELTDPPSSNAPLLERFSVDPSRLRTELGVEPTWTVREWIDSVLAERTLE